MRAKNCKNVRGKGGGRSNKRKKRRRKHNKKGERFFLDEEERGPQRERERERETCEKKRELLSEQKKITRSNHTKQRLTDSSFLLL